MVVFRRVGLPLGPGRARLDVRLAEMIALEETGRSLWMGVESRRIVLARVTCIDMRTLAIISNTKHK